MNRFTRLRPSPAMIVACVSLFVALGGVGYAAATIGSGQIKNNSVQGKDIKNSTITGKDVKNSGLTGSDIKNSSLAGRDVKNNSLTGSDILESSLGTVPSANTATTANSANTSSSADNVGGFQVGRINYFKQLPGSVTVTVLNFHGLKLDASCPAGDLSVIATNSGSKTAQIHQDAVTTGVSNETEDDTFDPGDTLELMPTTDTNATATLAYAASGGPTVTVSSLMEDGAACSYLGTAVGG